MGVSIGVIDANDTLKVPIQDIQQYRMNNQRRPNSEASSDDEHPPRNNRRLNNSRIPIRRQRSRNNRSTYNSGLRSAAQQRLARRLNRLRNAVSFQGQDLMPQHLPIEEVQLQANAARANLIQEFQNLSGPIEVIVEIQPPVPRHIPVPYITEYEDMEFYNEFTTVHESVEQIEIIPNDMAPTNQGIDEFIQQALAGTLPSTGYDNGMAPNQGIYEFIQQALAGTLPSTGYDTDPEIMNIPADDLDVSE